MEVHYSDEQVSISLVKLLGIILKFNCRPEIKHLIFGALGSIAIGVINPVQSIFFSRIFASYSLSANEVMDNLRPWLLVYVGLAVGMQIAYTVQGYFFGVAGQKLVYRCRYLL